jgi:hypothetical protein
VFCSSVPDGEQSPEAKQSRRFSFFNMNCELVLQALRQYLERTEKSHVDTVEQLEKIKDENDDLRFQVCECSKYLMILNIESLNDYNLYCSRSTLYLERD